GFGLTFFLIRVDPRSQSAFLRVPFFPLALTLLARPKQSANTWSVHGFRASLLLDAAVLEVDGDDLFCLLPAHFRSVSRRHLDGKVRFAENPLDLAFAHADLNLVIRIRQGIRCRGGETMVTNEQADRHQTAAEQEEEQSVRRVRLLGAYSGDG